MTQSAKANTRLPSLPEDEQRLIGELRGLKSRRSPRAARVEKAMRVLRETHSPRIRNAAALALADMRGVEGTEPLIELLILPTTKGSRSTLLYALDQLRAKVPLAVLAKVIAEDNYEAREEALVLLSRSARLSSPEDLAHARAILEKARTTADAERSGRIKRALEDLDADNASDG